MRLFSAFAKVGTATLASRLLGFPREILIASLVGAGPVADAFFAAFRFPNLFRRLFAEGAFNSAFVPLFAKELEGGGREAARLFAERVLSVLLATLILLSALAMIFMPFLVETIIAPKFGEGTEKTELTILLTRIMFPYLTCMSLVAMLSGVLNSMRQYFVAAFVPVLMNVVMIAVLLACLAFDTGNTPLTGKTMAWGIFVAGFLQLGVIWYEVHRQGFKLSIRIPKLTPEVRRLVWLAVPTAIASGITQINLLVGQIIASGQAGAISLLQYADRVYQLPLGIIGIAIGVVLLPEVARDLKAGKDDRAMEAQNQSLEFAMFLTLPAAAALVAIPLIITSVLFEHGAFDASATSGVAQALAAFAFGLPAFVLIKVFQPGFFAREDTKSPMIYAALNAVLNIALSIYLFPHFGHVGIAWATTISAWVNTALLAGGLTWRGHWRWRWGTIRRLVLMLSAAILMAVILVAFDGFVVAQGWYEHLALKVLALAALVLSGALAYFAMCHLVRAADLRAMVRNMRRSSN